MPDFANLTVICLGLILVGIWGHALLTTPRGKGPLWLAARALRSIPRAVSGLIPGRDRSLLTWLIRLAYLAAVLCFAVLFLTGFVPVFLGLRLTGYWLIVHVIFAPVFVVSVAFLVLVRAKANAFVGANAERLMAFLRLSVQTPTPVQDASLLRKGSFWLLAVLALPLTLSSVLSMFPILDTNGQDLMFIVHRFMALVVSLVVLVHSYAAVRYRLTKDVGFRVKG